MPANKKKRANYLIRPIRGRHDLVPVLRPVTKLPADLNLQLKA